MSHVESFSFHPEKDKRLIEWLRQPGETKSHKIKKALYLYMEVGNELDLSQLVSTLKLLPDIVSRLNSIDQKIAHGVAVNDSGNQETEDKQAILDIIAQMKGF